VQVRIPRLGIDQVLPFLVDTGADSTAISAALLGVPERHLGKLTTPARGIGGKARRWTVRGAQLLMQDGAVLRDVAPKGLCAIEGLADVCILGRDVLAEHGLALHLDVAQDELFLEA
jgi:hypothetical protein